MNSENDSAFAISLRDAACRRLPDVERHTLSAPDGSHARDIFVALPASYAKGKRRYPLVILLDAAPIAGSAIEMCRLMAQTREIRECILVGVETPFDRAADCAQFAAFLGGQLLPRCLAGYRVEQRSIALLGFATADAFALDTLRNLGLALETAAGGEHAVTVKVLESNGSLVPSLVRELRSLFSTNHAYGDEIVPLRRRPIVRALEFAAPWLKRIAPALPAGVRDPSARLVHATTLERDFEVFAALPASWKAGSPRRYPALVVLDANIEFSTVAETAARLAADGHIAELVVIGIGTPRVQGPLAFGFRRFEELSPPVDGYAFDDDLGRIFRSLFALRGQDARQRLGRAPEFLRFIAAELLPRLADQLPIDPLDLGLLGHSAAGTFVCYALSQASSPFRHYIAVSPGIGISDSWLVRTGADALLAPRAASAVLAVGSAELSNAFNRIAGIPQTEVYAARLRRHAALGVEFHCFDGQTHSSVFPIAVVRALSSTYRSANSWAQRKRLP
jgi:predicted alpha/beta superfamily hydrolase